MTPAPQDKAPAGANVSQDIDVWLARVLRGGTILAAIVIALGGLAYLLQHGNDAPHYAEFRGEPAKLTTITGIVESARSGESRGLIMAGLLLLVATPIARVLGALVAFARQRDLTYAVVSALILVALLYGLLAS